MLDDNARAEQDFSAAISKNPNYFSHYLARGVLRYENGRKQQALADLDKSHQLLPTPTAAYYLGEQADGSGNSAKAMGYYQQAAQSSGELGKKAQTRLAVLELAQTPHKYIASSPYLGNDGYLWVVVKNNSPLAVTGVQVQLADMNVRKSSALSGPARLNPGEQFVIKTRIGPMADRNELARFRTQVTAAKPAK